MAGDKDSNSTEQTTTIKYIQKKSTVQPITGKIVDTLNIEDREKNTYSARIISMLLNSISVSGGGGDFTPIGSGMDFYGQVPPENYMFADGAAISRTEYSELFEIIGTTYGAGDGSTTFNLPDKRERVSVMYKAGSTNGTSEATLGTLGAKGGEFKHTQTVNEMPSHTHTFTGSASSFSGSGNLKRGDYTVVAADANGGSTWRYILKGSTGLSTYSDYYSMSISGSVTAAGSNSSTGNSEPMNIMQPYLVCNYIIKVKNGSSSSIDVQAILEGEY